jgi:hypothetical protein
LDLIITDAVEILKKENSGIAKEKALMIYLFGVIREIMRQAYEALDDALVEEYKEKGYEIEKKNSRTILTLLGEITFRRRRFIKEGTAPVYALDKFIGLKSYSRYSLLTQRNICELVSKTSYRHAEKAIELLTDFTMSHRKINRLAINIGKILKEQQRSETRYDILKALKRKVAMLTIEGDGIDIHGRGKQKLTIHRFQICEGKKLIGTKRKELVGYKVFSSMDRKKAYGELLEYIANTYDLTETLVVTNSDGGSGYEKEVFDELAQGCLRHAHFRDRYHVHKKVKERLYFFKDIQYYLIQCISNYDWNSVCALLDTIESSLCVEENRDKEIEYVQKLKSYLERNWEYLEPFYSRNFPEGSKNCLGTCESNHRIYTYRMKKQGRYWTKEGAESMVRIIDALVNRELDMWLETDYEPEISEKELKKKYQLATRTATSKKWNGHDEHEGVFHCSLTLNNHGYYAH